jgi:hypothetical protein
MQTKNKQLSDLVTLVADMLGGFNISCVTVTHTKGMPHPSPPSSISKDIHYSLVFDGGLLEICDVLAAGMEQE